MGGTDTFDQRLSYYRPRIKTSRSPKRVFVHFQNACVVDAFIIHGQYQKAVKTFQLRHFIEKLAFDLVPQINNSASPEVPPVFRRRKTQ